MRGLILITFLFLLSFSTTGQTVMIKGNAPDYSQSRVYVYSYADWITKTEENLGFFDVDRDGNFSIKLHINETKLIFFSLFAYKGYSLGALSDFLYLHYKILINKI